MDINDLELAGVTVHYAEIGPAQSSALPLLLLHGFLGSSGDWVDVMPLLGRRRRVVAVDHRGHGASSKFGVAAAYTFDALLDDLCRAVDALGLGRFHLVGHSMGGVIAMRYALTAPDRLASLVLVDTAAAPAGRLPREIIDMLVATGRSSGMAAVAELIVGSLPVATEEQKRRGRQKFGAVDVEAFAGFADELERYPDLLPQLASLDVPTTVICGANDELLPACERLAVTITTATLDVMAGAGHSPFEDDREQWIALVESHLERSEAELVG